MNRRDYERTTMFDNRLSIALHSLARSLDAVDNAITEMEMREEGINVTTEIIISDFTGIHAEIGKSVARLRSMSNKR